MEIIVPYNLADSLTGRFRSLMMSFSDPRNFWVGKWGEGGGEAYQPQTPHN